MEYCYHAKGDVRNYHLDMLHTEPKRLGTDKKLRSPECFMITDPLIIKEEISFKEVIWN